MGLLRGLKTDRDRYLCFEGRGVEERFRTPEEWGSKWVMKADNCSVMRVRRVAR